MAAGGRAEHHGKGVAMLDNTDDTGSTVQDNDPGLNSLTALRQRALRDEALHGLAGEVIDTIGPNSEADPAALLLHFLTMFGNAIGDGLYVQLGPNQHPARLFTVIVGDAALGRKGTAGSEIKHLMSKVDNKWYTETLLSGMRSAESIVSVVDDDQGQGNQLMLYYSEFGDLLSTMGKQNTISDVLKDAYDGSILTVRTKKRSGWLTASHAHISMIGHVTPTVLTDRLSESDIASGLASRLLFAKVERSKEISRPKPVDKDKFEALVNSVHEVLEWATEYTFEGVDPISATLYRQLDRKPKKEIHLTEAAWDYWDVLYHELSVKRHGVIGELAVRGPANVRRLALIYAILDKSPVIDVIHLKSANAVWEYSEASAKGIFTGFTGDYQVDKVLRALESANDNTLTKSDIHAMFSRHYSAGRIANIIKGLLETELVVETKIPTGGRPVYTYTLMESVGSEKTSLEIPSPDSKASIE
jgi:uncharacterized protein DUF3987